MKGVGIIGLNLAKNLSYAHGAGTDGSVVFRRKLLPPQLLKFTGQQRHPPVLAESRTAQNPASEAQAS